MTHPLKTAMLRESIQRIDKMLITFNTSVIRQFFCDLITEKDCRRFSEISLSDLDLLTDLLIEKTNFPVQHIYEANTALEAIFCDVLVEYKQADGWLSFKAKELGGFDAANELFRQSL